MHQLKVALVSALALAGAAALSSASAAPAGDLGSAARAATNTQEVRWVCGPYRCFWRPGPVIVGPRFYGPPVRAYGWGPRPWRGYGWRRW